MRGMSGAFSLTSKLHLMRPACLVAVMALAGCGSSEVKDRLQVYPVSGKVLVNGKPADGATLMFFGATPELQGPGSVSPGGTANEDGEFSLGSYGLDDGAPAGKFNVAVLWHEPIPAGVDRERFQAKDRLKGRYAIPENSGLTVEIPEGGTTLPPFELK